MPTFKNFLEMKKAVRQDLHGVLGVSSKHISALTGKVSKCSIRVHTKIQLVGDVDYQGFAELSDGSVLILCPISEARALQFAAEDKIIYNNQEYVLHTCLDDDTVYLEKWQATHTQGKVVHD